MSTAYFPWFDTRFVDGNGLPLSGGKIYAFYDGTTTPAVTFNQNGIANSHPIILDSAGRCDMLGDDSITYTIKSYTSSNALVKTYIGVALPSGTGGGTTVTMDTIVQGTSYKKMTASNVNSLTQGANTTLHYHSADRAWSTLTGKPSTFAPATHASTHNSGGSDALSHNNLAPTLAGPGVTYGHINDTTQTIYGTKTLDGITKVINSADDNSILIVEGLDSVSQLSANSNTSALSLSNTHGGIASNVTISANEYGCNTSTTVTTVGGDTSQLATVVNGDETIQTFTSTNNANTFVIRTYGTDTTFTQNGIIYYLPETVSDPDDGIYGIATREWVVANPVTGGYNFTVSYPANLWTITHNLGYKPVVQSWNSSDDVIIGTIHHVSVNQCTILFSSGQSGGARCV